MKDTLTGDRSSVGPKDSADDDLLVNDMLNLDFEQLDITTEDVSFDEVGERIQENLEDELLKSALEQGTDLRQYAQGVEDELHKVERASIQEYLAQADAIAQLHGQMRGCDELLSGMEQMLSVFQADLGSISAEIQVLQAQSLSMSEKLKNRQAVQNSLHKIVKELAIPPDMIELITHGDINESYVECLAVLHNKIQFAKRQNKRDIGCLDEVLPELEKLKIKGVDRVREFLYQKILKIREESPMRTNIQLHQQNQLLPYRYFLNFLKQYNKPVAQEICAVYVDTMQKCMYSLLKHYIKKLSALKIEEAADKDDLIGAPEGAKRLFFSSKLAQKQHIFTLGERAHILKELEETVILPHVADKRHDRFHLEQLYRSINYAVLDNACHEYLFILEFFQVKSTAAIDIFNAVFDKSLAMVKRHMEDIVGASYDVIGLLLCIRMTNHFERLAHSRRIPILEKFHAAMEMLLWPRVKSLVDLNVDSVKKCAEAPRSLGSIDTRPHYVTRRYAEFSASVVRINQAWNDPQIQASLLRLRNEFEAFLTSLAGLLPTAKERLVCFINNYDLVLTVLQEQTEESSAESQHFTLQLNAKIQEYMMEELSPFIRDMIAFVDQYEPVIDSSPDTIKCDQVRVEAIVRSFAADWRRAIDSINADVLQSFTNFKVGTDILQAVLTGLILYYQRFIAILNKRPFKSLAVRNELINIHHVMVEVKKHRTTF